MLEHALRQERLKATGAPVSAEQAAALPPQGAALPTLSGTSFPTKTFKPKTATKGSLILQRHVSFTPSHIIALIVSLLFRYLEELGATEELLASRAASGVAARRALGSAAPAAASASLADPIMPATAAKSLPDAFAAPAAFNASSIKSTASDHIAATGAGAGGSGVFPSSVGPGHAAASAAMFGSAASGGAPLKALSEPQTTSEAAATSWAPSFVLRAHLDCVRALAFTETHPALVSASDDGSVKLWNLRKLTRGRDDVEPVFSYRGHTSAVLSLAVSEQRQQIVSGGLDSTVRVWDLLSATSHNVRLSASISSSFCSSAYRLILCYFASKAVLDDTRTGCGLPQLGRRCVVSRR